MLRLMRARKEVETARQTVVAYATRLIASTLSSHWKPSIQASRSTPVETPKAASVARCHSRWASTWERSADAACQQAAAVNAASIASGGGVRQCTACIQPRGIRDEFQEQRMLVPHGVGPSAVTAGHYATKLRRPFCEQVHLLFALSDFVAFGGTSILAEGSI
jgi:hypothetical protein